MSENQKAPLVALAGSPNCGKTALFNVMTGSRQKVANYTGVTVERKEGIALTRSGRRVSVLDLPGTYSLDPQTPDEVVARDVLARKLDDVAAPDVIVAVVDATNLERHLSFILELKDLGTPIVVALNMMDLAKRRGLELDIDALSQELGVPVIATVATRKWGLDELMEAVEATLKRRPVTKEFDWERPSVEELKERFEEVDRILGKSVRKASAPAYWSDRVDEVLLHPVFGTVILATLMMVIFQAVFTWAGPLQDGIESLVGALGVFFGALIPDGPINSLVVDGIIAGVGSVVVFLPQILLLFFFILLLEDSGYMARAAFLMDRLMGSVGLHGRAFLPLLSSFACAIPGIMATRTIENRRDRLTTIMVAPLMTCAARLPVYTLLIGAFIPATTLYGFQLQGLVMFALYLAGIFGAIAVAFVLKRSAFKGAKPPFLLELPTYKVPSWRNLAMGLYERGRVFLKRAGTLIMSITIILWFLVSYPKQDPSSTEPAIYSSYAAKIGKAIEPVFEPLGFDWRVSMALVPGLAAREVMVGALATVYSVESSQAVEAEIQAGAEEEEAVSNVLGSQISKEWSLATALSLLVWYIFAPQCLATLAVARRETNSWTWPVVMGIYLTTLAYFGSFIVFRLVSFLT